MSSSSGGYDARVLLVLLASPGDVETERKELPTVITNWNYLHGEEYGIVLQPVRWEDVATPELGDRPQEIINRQLVDKCQILIGMFWSRIGTPSGVEEGGAVEEIERFIRDDKRVLLYFSNRDLPRRTDSYQLGRVDEYKKRMSARGLVGDYATPADLREQVLRHLTQVVQEIRRIAPQAGSAPAATPIVPPPDRLDSRKVANADLKRIATLLLEHMPADVQWSRGRWKTIYTIDLRARLPQAALPGGTLIQVVRAAGQEIAAAIAAGTQSVTDYYGDRAIVAAPVLDPAWFVEQLLDSAERKLRTPGQSSVRFEQHEAGVSSDVLARVLLCEILVCALLHLRGGQRVQRRLLVENALGNNLLPIAQLVRELLVYNALRSIDGHDSISLNTLLSTAPNNVLDFVWPVQGRTAPELDYLLRWQSRMNVVVLSDDCTRARFPGIGPFIDKPGFEDSYSAFAEAAGTRGLEIDLANYADVDLDQRRVDAWRFDRGGWVPERGIYSEFFYDKFPMNLETAELKGQLARDRRLVTWNKVVFTELLADKHQISTLLEAAKVPVISPTRKMPNGASREQRAELLRSLADEARPRNCSVQGRWLIVKPLTGWGGHGVQRMSEEQFLSADFSVAPYSEFAGIVVQPFFESEVTIPELGITGRHDVRIVFVGAKPVFGMIRELPAGTDEPAASFANVKKLGGRRRYVEVRDIVARGDAAKLVTRVPEALGEAFNTPAIYSVDFFWVRQDDKIVPMVVELNSKPSQVWQPDDEQGQHYRFHAAIIDELAAFHD
jgi:hypothetical protein